MNRNPLDIAVKDLLGSFNRGDYSVNMPLVILTELRIANLMTLLSNQMLLSQLGLSQEEVFRELQQLMELRKLSSFTNEGVEHQR